MLVIQAEQKQQMGGTNPINLCAVLEDDPALWPKELTDKERRSIVQRGPVQVKDRIFPKHHVF